MSFFSEIKNKVATKMLGELITDLGTLPIDKHGREISLSIRRHAGQEPHLQVKLDSGELNYFQINCSVAWADQFERVAREMRKHTDAPKA